MRYNDTQYNAGEYNFTLFVQNLSESMTESDTLTKSVISVRTESQATADVLSDSQSLAAFLETVSILQRATYGVVYNSVGYNEAMYNATVDNDELLLQIGKVLQDSVGSTDAITTLNAIKGLIESITETDVLLFIQSPMFNDFVFLSEFIRIEITNKALNETLRLADWLTIKRKPGSNEWYD